MALSRTSRHSELNGWSFLPTAPDLGGALTGSSRERLALFLADGVAQNLDLAPSAGRVLGAVTVALITWHSAGLANMGTQLLLSPAERVLAV